MKEVGEVAAVVMFGARWRQSFERGCARVACMVCSCECRDGGVVGVAKSAFGGREAAGVRASVPASYMME